MGIADSLVILDAELMIARHQSHITYVCARFRIMPLINDQAVIYPYAHTLVRRGKEAVVPRGHSKVPRPTHRESICAQTAARPSGSPIEVNLGIIPNQNRLSFR